MPTVVNITIADKILTKSIYVIYNLDKIISINNYKCLITNYKCLITKLSYARPPFIIRLSNFFILLN